MKMVRGAIFAGVCLAAAAASTANASTVFGFSDTILQGQDKTYTVNLAPGLIVTSGVTPYLMLTAVVHATTNYHEYSDGRIPDRTVEVYQETTVCAGKLDCYGNLSSAGLILNVVTVGDIMKITAKNATEDYDICSLVNDRFCAFSTGPATFSVGFRYDDPETPFSYTVQQNGVPEPATWGLMILGFGLVGAAYRRTNSMVRA